MEQSKADVFRTLPEDEQQRRAAEMTELEAEALLFDWDFWARPSQVLPYGEDWITWLVMAGRGFGKTRIGAETTRGWAISGLHRVVNLIGATSSDVRDIMIEGESGIMAICPKGERPLYQPSKSRLVWPNGVVSLLFSAEEPERLRGKQHAKLWCDELAAWTYHESWDQASFGLRLGQSPQVVVTTTPKPVKLIKDLIDDPTTIVTRGSTYDNKHNLATAFLSKVVVKYEGTRLGRQELNAELLEDNPNALWTHACIDKLRIDASQLPTSLSRIVVAVDPAVTANKNSDETGIVVAARDTQSPPHFYILADATLSASPAGWASAVVRTFDLHSADRIVGEVNQGGDLVESNVRTKREDIPFKAVHATRGKVVRAEPISGLYEQGRVHHVGTFGNLEDQMCDFDPQLEAGQQPSPDRMDALVWALTELSEGNMVLALPEVLEMIKRGELVPGKPALTTRMGSAMNKVKTSNLVKPVVSDDTLSCPKCGAVCVVRVGAQWHCNACAHQWGELPKVNRGPSRNELLGSKQTRIIKAR